MRARSDPSTCRLQVAETLRSGRCGGRRAGWAADDALARSEPRGDRTRRELTRAGSGSGGTTGWEHQRQGNLPVGQPLIPRGVAPSRPALSVAAAAAASDRETSAAGFGYVRPGTAGPNGAQVRGWASRCMPGVRAASTSTRSGCDSSRGSTGTRRCGDPRRVRAATQSSRPAPAPTRTPPATPGTSRRRGWRAPRTLSWPANLRRGVSMIGSLDEGAPYYAESWLLPPGCWVKSHDVV
jgi:hypothetical protein